MNEEKKERSIAEKRFFFIYLCWKEPRIFTTLNKKVNNVQVLCLFFMWARKNDVLNRTHIYIYTLDIQRTNERKKQIESGWENKIGTALANEWTKECKSLLRLYACRVYFSVFWTCVCICVYVCKRWRGFSMRKVKQPQSL